MLQVLRIFLIWNTKSLFLEYIFLILKANFNERHTKSIVHLNSSIFSLRGKKKKKKAKNKGEMIIQERGGNHLSALVV